MTIFEHKNSTDFPDQEVDTVVLFCIDKESMEKLLYKTKEHGHWLFKRTEDYSTAKHLLSKYENLRLLWVMNKIKFKVDPSPIQPMKTDAPETSINKRDDEHTSEDSRGEDLGSVVSKPSRKRSVSRKQRVKRQESPKSSEAE